jgi:AcrR family transcriptional regulator
MNPPWSSRRLHIHPTGRTNRVDSRVDCLSTGWTRARRNLQNDDKLLRVKDAGNRRVNRKRSVQTEPGSDPASLLPPRARHLLAAARGLFVQGGYSAMSLQAVADAAGEQKSTIAYYFGDKAGLVAALSDLLIHDAKKSFRGPSDEPSLAEDVVAAGLDRHMQMVRERIYWQLIFSLQPELIHDPQLRTRFIEHLQSANDGVLQSVGFPPEAAASEELRPLGALLMAVVEGFALQHELLRDEATLEANFDMWRQIIAPYLEGLMTKNEAREKKQQ